jgi:hypothetical protein
LRNLMLEGMSDDITCCHHQFWSLSNDEVFDRNEPMQWQRTMS